MRRKIIIAILSAVPAIITAIAAIANKSSSAGIVAALLAIIPLVTVISILVNKNKKENKEEKGNENEKHYTKKPYMTPTEKQFYDKLLQATIGMNVKVIPQIPLSSVVQKKENERYQNELYRVIDYGIFNSNFEIILLIELNDKTHNKKERRDRDVKVQKICAAAKIQLITFWVGEPNEVYYIKSRIENLANAA